MRSSVIIFCDHFSFHWKILSRKSRYWKKCLKYNSPLMKLFDSFRRISDNVLKYLFCVLAEAGCSCRCLQFIFSIVCNSWPYNMKKKHLVSRLWFMTHESWLMIHDPIFRAEKMITNLVGRGYFPVLPASMDTEWCFSSGVSSRPVLVMITIYINVVYHHFHSK